MQSTHRLPSGEHLVLPPTDPKERVSGLYRHAHQGKAPHTVGMPFEQWVREHCDPSDGLKPLKGEHGWVGLLNPRTKEVYSLTGPLAKGAAPAAQASPGGTHGETDQAPPKQEPAKIEGGKPEPGKEPGKEKPPAPPMGGGKPPA